MRLDPIRDLILRLLEERDLTMKEVSLKMGRNHAYMRQYLKQGTPDRLEEDDREKLASILGVDEGDLRPTPPRIAKISTSAPLGDVSNDKKVTQRTDSGVTTNVGEMGPAPSLRELPRDLPAKGVAAGSELGVGDFRFLNGEVVDYVRRPPRLAGVKDAFVVYLTGDSMAPRYKHGAPVYIHPGQPARIGDDVLVELAPERDGEAGECLVKELVRRGTKIRLKQHTPPKFIEIDAKRVRVIYRVVPYDELLNF